MLWFHSLDCPGESGSSFAPFRKLDLKDHHELLYLQRHAILAFPGIVDLENFPYEMGSQPDVFQTQNDFIINTFLPGT